MDEGTGFPDGGRGLVVMTPPLHGGGRGFDSHRPHQKAFAGELGTFFRRFLSVGIDSNVEQMRDRSSDQISSTSKGTGDWGSSETGLSRTSLSDERARSLFSLLLPASSQSSCSSGVTGT